MKKHTARICAGIVLVATCSSVQATFVQDKQIKRIYPTTDTIYFRLKEDTCIGASQYYYFKMNDTDATGKYAAKNWYSMLLASAMAGKPISIKVPACQTEGNVNINYIFQEY